MRELKHKGKKHAYFGVGMLLLLLVGGVLFLSACSDNQDEDPKAHMINYYNIEEVQSYHRELKDVIIDTADALKKDDEKLMESALKELETLCEGFKTVSDVPESLKYYHEKMVEVADVLQSYSKHIKNDDVDAAAEELKEAEALLQEAQALLPNSAS